MKKDSCREREREMMRNAEEHVSRCGEKGVRPNSDVQSVVIYRLLRVSVVTWLCRRNGNLLYDKA